MLKTIQQCVDKSISVRYQWLKPLNSVQIKTLVLDINAWNHWSVLKKNLVLHKTIEQYKNKNSGITYQYLKPLNTV